MACWKRPKKQKNPPDGSPCAYISIFPTTRSERKKYADMNLTANSIFHHDLQLLIFPQKKFEEKKRRVRNSTRSGHGKAVLVVGNALGRLLGGK
jgi:hypothetical protein